MSERVETGRSTSSSSGEPSLGQLVAAASKDLSALVRSEIELAKLELTAAGKRAGVGAGLLGGAGFLAIFGLAFLSIALAFGLRGLGLSLGVAFLIVGVLYVLGAGLFALIARRQLKKLKPPERTIRTVREDVEWAKHPTLPATAKGGSTPH